MITIAVVLITRADPTYLHQLESERRNSVDETEQPALVDGRCQEHGLHRFLDR